MLTIGGLFHGYGGIELGLAQHLPVETRWYAEFDKAASRIGAQRNPGIPNLGDVTRIDWRKAEPVDVITGGSPCPDLSTAGKRKGMTDGTRSNLWQEMREAIAVIRPRLVVWENVRGALSARASSDVEREPGLLGVRRDGPALRALGRVLGDLASLGYDARWYGLRAADVGAPHGRFRIFLFATPADADGSGWLELRRSAAVRAQHTPAQCPSAAPDLTLLPTPAVNDMGAGKSVEQWDAWTDRMKSEHGNGNGHGKSLSIEALRLLPTPRGSDANGAGPHGDGGLDLRTAVTLLPTPRATRGGSHTETTRLLSTPRATDGSKGGPNQRGSSGDLMLPSAVHRPLPTPSVADTQGGRKSRSGARSDELLLNGIAATQQWGQYEAAIRRWEALTRPAPEPTEVGRNGPRLSAPFVEWMMGLPGGWVTQIDDLSRNDQLKALGNGVVPQQCAAATAAWLSDVRSEVAA